MAFTFLGGGYNNGMYLEMLYNRYGSALEKQAAAIGGLVAKAVKPRTFGGFFGKMVGSNTARIGQQVNKLRTFDPKLVKITSVPYTASTDEYKNMLDYFRNNASIYAIPRNASLSQGGIKSMKDAIRNAVPDLSKRYLP